MNVERRGPAQALSARQGDGSVVARSTAKLGVRPLYLQVEDILTARIAEGEWQPGLLLPAEQDIAAELGVSQGTVRKALDALERRHLIERRQGRGTFVASQTSARSLQHFLHIVDSAGRRIAPVSRVLASASGEADALDAMRLGIRPGAPVHRIVRVRLVNDVPRLLERITLPIDHYPGVEQLGAEEIPAQLYVLYQRRFGVTVVRATESLAAISLDAEAAASLRLAAGAPVLEVDRLAYDIQDRAVERRVMLLDTRELRYHSVLG